MITLRDGPGAGQQLMLRSGAIVLRITRNSKTGQWDALDQPEDIAKPEEEIFVYRLVPGTQGSVHISCRGKDRARSGLYAIGEYALWPDQPGDAVCRDLEAFRAWCGANKLALKAGLWKTRGAGAPGLTDETRGVIRPHDPVPRRLEAGMKALSLWQPWATLMVIGAKRNETRGRWDYHHTGPVAIHAALQWNRDLVAFCLKPEFKRALAPLKPDLPAFYDHCLPRWGRPGKSPPEKHLHPMLPLGAIVGVVDIVGSTIALNPGTRNQPADGRSGFLIDPRSIEGHFGDYTPGRAVIFTENPRRLVTPVAYTGQQGLFDVPDSILEGPFHA